MSLTTVSANDAPTPLVLPSLACFAAASVVLARFVVAFRVTSAPLTVAAGVVPSISLVVLFTTTTTAIDPATPTLLPPAPEIAVAP